MDLHEFRVGDNVYVGPVPRTDFDRRVHWVIERISPANHSDPVARLISPLSDRHRFERVANLTLHSRGSLDSAPLTEVPERTTT